MFCVTTSNWRSQSDRLNRLFCALIPVFGIQWTTHAQTRIADSTGMQSSLTSAYRIKHRRYNLGFNINDIANYANAGIPFDSVMANTAQCLLRWSKDIMPYTASTLLKFNLLSNYNYMIFSNHEGVLISP